MACVDAKNDPKHCGACNNACATGQYCNEGVCAAVNGCISPRQLCGTTCTDTSIDARNCGSCGNACATGRACLNRMCL